MKPTEYGNFSEDGNEYVLEQPLLARPWMNVLSNGAWCYVASHLGGGYSFLGNPTVARITRWHIDGMPRDTVGKFVYLRDEETGEAWSANGYPPTRPLDAWRCRIGLGYNTIESSNHGIDASITYFTPMPDARTATGEDVGDPCEIWMVRLTNTSKKTRKLTATNYAEIALGNWFEDTSWREFYLLFNRQEFRDEVLYTRSTQWVKYLGGWQAANSDANNIGFDKAVFMASSEKVVAFEGDREEFIGPYRDLGDPQALAARRLSGQLADGRDACEALQHRITLKPGQSKDYVIVFGAIPAQKRSAGALLRKYGSVDGANKAFANMRAYWDKVAASPEIETPDPDLDVVVNKWYKYQGSNLSWWNRNTGYCYSGIYNFGVRDACQDAASRLPQDPRWVRDHIVKRIMIWQFDDGDYAHGGNFVSMQGTRTFHSDDPINPFFILARYVKETGDFSILEEQTQWVDPETCVSGMSSKPPATIYEHLMTGLDWFFKQFSKRKLPLIMKADWNDALDQVGNAHKGDSVMLACWAIYCVEQFYPCMAHMGDRTGLQRTRRRLTALKKRVNEIGWDGDWYQRAMHDDGTILGSKRSKYGRIWANPNSFAIVSGVADAERTAKILASFDRYLDDPLGSRTFWPVFARPEPKAGIISRFQPGTKENGSIFGHSSRWRIWAECHAGRGDKAYEIYCKMDPLKNHERNAARYCIEPYVACQFINGPESHRGGEGSHSWATGTACWTLMNVWESMLGVQPEVEGLRIDPCLPSKWTWARMRRDFRGARYEIAIKKKRGICKGPVRIELDGEELPGNVIPAQPAGSVNQVRVVVG
ncbi:MAG: GH36-type glycosyl hydrolase domain-containing protein [Planctomycetota bacterium]